MALFFRKKKLVADNEAGGAPVNSAPARLEPDEIKTNSHVELDAEMDLEGFWHDTQESLLRHTCPPLNARMIEQVERELGHTLPVSYIQLMRRKNGGLVNRCRFRVAALKSGCPDTIYITDIMGIGNEAPYSLCGKYGSRFLIETRKHNPDIGIAICNTTLPGRALVFLDYRACDTFGGEPCVTWADAQTHTELMLARNFKEFISGLEVNTVER